MEIQSKDFIRRAPVVFAILAVIIMMAMMPSRIQMLPKYAHYLILIPLLVPMIMVGLSSNKPHWARIEHAMTLIVCLLLVVLNLLYLKGLIVAMIFKSDETTGIMLLASSITAWLTNVLVFTLAYWQIDRGGPQGRIDHTIIKPDWHFPNTDYAGEVPDNWQPSFIDYLYLGFSTATAFSTTEAVPVTRRAKILMMVESTISLLTILVVGARAVNILAN